MNILNFVDGVVIISMIGGLLVALISTVAVMRSREKDQEVLIVKLVEEHVAATAALTTSHEGVLATVRLLYSDLMVQALKEQYLTFHRPLASLREDLKESRGEKRVAKSNPKATHTTTTAEVLEIQRQKKNRQKDSYYTSVFKKTPDSEMQKINQNKNRPR